MSDVHITSLLNIVTAKQRPSLDAQKTRAIYKKRYTLRVTMSNSAINSNKNHDLVMKQINDMADFWEQLADENDRGVALSAGEMFSELLKDLLLMKFSNTKESRDLIDGFNAPIGTYSSRIKMAYALSYITEEEKKDLECIRKIRNEFAHNWKKVTFKNEKISDQCKNLIHCGKELQDSSSRFYREPREQFNISCAKISQAISSRLLQNV